MTVKEHAWLSLNVTVCPGFIAVKYVVGIKAVVTKDVLYYAFVVGEPAKVIKYLDPSEIKE